MGVINVKEDAQQRIERAHKRVVKSAVTSTLVLGIESTVSNGMLVKEGSAPGTYELADESTATALINYLPELEDEMPNGEITLAAGSYKASIALSGFCRMVDLGSEADNWTAFQRLRQFGIQAEVLGAIYG